MKALVLFLVMSLATVSSAAATGVSIDITVNGAPWNGEDIIFSDWIKITATADGITMGMLETNLAVSNGDQIGTLNAYNIGWLMPPLSDVIPEGEGFKIFYSAPSGFTPNTGVMYDLEFHFPDYMQPSDFILIDAISGKWNGIDAIAGPDDGLPYIAIHHTIPEPMTIGLLAIGGLVALHRRRSA